MACMHSSQHSPNAQSLPVAVILDVACLVDVNTAAALATGRYVPVSVIECKLVLQVDAFVVADHTGVAVQHELIAAIRRASSTPDQAVDFFTSVLHPNPAKRSTASQAAAHPYLRTAMRKIPRDWSTGAAPNASDITESAQHNCGSSAQCVEESDDSGTYDSVVSVHSADEEAQADRASTKPSVVGRRHPLAAAAGALKHLGSGLKSLFGRPQQRAAAFDTSVTLSPQPHDATPSSAIAPSSLGQHSDPGLKSITGGRQSRSYAVSAHGQQQSAATSAVASPISQVMSSQSARSPRLNMALFPSLPAIKSSAAQLPQAFDPFILTPSTEQNPTSSSSIQHTAQQSEAAPAISTKAEVQSKAQARRTVVQLTADCTAKPATRQTAQEGAVSAVPAVKRKKKASAVKQSKSKAANSVRATCFGKHAAAEGTPVTEAPCSDAKKTQR